MMIQESMRLKVLILPLSLVITVIAAIFFIKPAYSEMMTSKDTLTSKQKELESLKTQTQKLQALKTKWAAMADEKSLVAAAFPETQDADSYISEITSKASRSGVLLTDIELDKPESGGLTQSPDYICSADSGESSAASAETATAVAPVNVSSPQNTPAASGACLNSITITLAAKGSWEQMLDFFKYLEDMNRISNIESLTLSTETQVQSQNQPASVILSVDISANAFFKQKSQSGNAALATNLSNQGSFNQNSLEKLKETIYAPYDAPAMSPSGERNIFK
jgi:Tfp pilus assembly protein PilO